MDQSGYSLFGTSTAAFDDIADILFHAINLVAKRPLAQVAPAPLRADEATFIKQTVSRFYGQDAVVRNYGPNPARLDLHVETGLDPSMEKYDCLGVLMTRIERDQISLEVTKRGRRVRSNAKIAYRQGIIL